MRCAIQTPFWAYPDATGSSLVQIDGIAIAADGVTCTSAQLVVMTQQEFDYATVSPFRLDMAAAGQISVAIMGVWAVGFAFRALIRMLRDNDDSQHLES